MDCCKGSDAESCRNWFTGTHFFIYLSHFLSAWGDRMWSFGVGIFLITITPDSLQLTAVYGLCMGLSILLFGALIGDIVDEVPRLKAAQVALVLQNAMVVLDALIIFLYLIYKTEIVEIGTWFTHLCQAMIIFVCVLSRMFSEARKLAVEKDWIVEICGRDKDKLATMTASLRRIDLSTQILAPIATGAVMAVTEVEIGALFIGGWNLGSVFVEYYFLWKVYNTVPALQKQKELSKKQLKKLKEAEQQATNNEEIEEEEKKKALEGTAVDEMPLNDQQNDDASPIKESERPLTVEIKVIQAKTEDTEEKQRKCGHCTRMFNSLERLYKGWPIFARYDEALAGVGLACLYMTVLGFDSITVGYAKMQGISEGILGLMMGAAAFCGILGTVMYPLMRRHLGLHRTGIFGLSAEVLTLILCVLSVFMPGSPFDLSIGYHVASPHHESNCTQDSSNNTTPSLFSLSSPNNTIPYAVTGNQSTIVINASFDNMTHNKTSECVDSTLVGPESVVSVWMLLTGIVLARFGLWVADLTITQLFLESVAESERGKVNGVQGSLNQLMNLLKFVMVVLAPYSHQFGLLVFISFFFICLGWLFYAIYLRKERGHFFHYPSKKCITCSSATQANGAHHANQTV